MDIRSRTYWSANENGLEEITIERYAHLGDFISQIFKSFSFSPPSTVEKTWVKKDGLWVDKFTDEVPNHKEMTKIAYALAELKHYKLPGHKSDWM